MLVISKEEISDQTLFGKRDDEFWEVVKAFVIDSELKWFLSSRIGRKIMREKEDGMIAVEKMRSDKGSGRLARELIPRIRPISLSKV